MEEFIVLVNFKCYEKATGEAAVTLAEACERFGAVVAVQHPDLYRVCSQSNATVFSQHIDPVVYGSHTGSVMPESVVACGATGTLLNHAEKQLDMDVLENSILRAHEAGLAVMVCANSLEKAKEIDTMNPDYIALELPELIGGDISIVSADPSLISDAVKALETPVLVGAGVHSGEDVRVAKELGAAGVLLASAVAAKTDTPEKVLEDLYSGLM